LEKQPLDQWWFAFKLLWSLCCSVFVVLNNSHLFWRASFVLSLLSLHLIQFLDTVDFQGCVPVFLDDDTVDQYYNGYCNNVLWPLFHYIGLPQEDRLAATRSMDSQFNAYNHANQLFAQVVFSQYQVLQALSATHVSLGACPQLGLRTQETDEQPFPLLPLLLPPKKSHFKLA
jgi:hypothetical protein